MRYSGVLIGGWNPGIHVSSRIQCLSAFKLDIKKFISRYLFCLPNLQYCRCLTTSKNTEIPDYWRIYKEVSKKQIKQSNTFSTWTKSLKQPDKILKLCSRGEYQYNEIWEPRRDKIDCAYHLCSLQILGGQRFLFLMHLLNLQILFCLCQVLQEWINHDVHLDWSVKYSAKKLI